MNKPYIIMGVAVLLITSITIITQEHSPEAVYLFSPSCHICQKLAPSVDKYLADHPGTTLEKINVNSDRGKELANKHNIAGVPVAIINGELVYYYGDEDAFIKQIDYRLLVVSE